MDLRAVDPVADGKMLAMELPQPIRNDRELERMVARLEALDFVKRKLTPEEALRQVLAALIEVYDQAHR